MAFAGLLEKIVYPKGRMRRKRRGVCIANFPCGDMPELGGKIYAENISICK
jgi:hypothetical protein